MDRLGQRSLSCAEVADHARYYRELGAFLRESYRPGEARLLASWSSTDGLRVVQAALPEYAGDVAQAVASVPPLPSASLSLPWYRLMTPAQVRAEGRPVYAVVRTKEDPPYQLDPALFREGWDEVEIGPGHSVYRLRRSGIIETP